MTAGALDVVMEVLEDQVDPPEHDGAADALTDDLLRRLDASIDALWSQARSGDLWRHVEANGFDRELYRILMVQIYHYTRHNSVNQAVAVLRADPDQMGLLRFVYRHAQEELGHEKLALHDLRAIGLLGKDEPITDAPLPATDALINYIYSVALREGPVARLGYSYWAENVYEHIAPMLGRARTSLGLTDREMAFFVAHADIDEDHSQDVVRAIRRAVTTHEQADAVHRVAVTTLWLTLALMDQAYLAWAGAA